MIDLLLQGIESVYYPAIFAAFVLYFLVGILWYSPGGLFGRAWLVDTGLASRPGGYSFQPKSRILGALAMLAALLHLGVILQPDMMRPTALNLGIVALVLTLIHGNLVATNYAYERKPARLWWINVGYVFIILLALALGNAVQYYYVIGADRLTEFHYKWISHSATQVPWLALPIGIVLHQLLGFLWYSKLFGAVWMQEAGMKPADVGREAALAALKKALLFGLLTFGLLTLLFAMYRVEGWIGALLVGPPVAIFHALMVGMNCAFEERSLRYFVITAGYPSLSIVLYALLYGLTG